MYIYILNVFLFLAHTVYLVTKVPQDVGPL